MFKCLHEYVNSHEKSQAFGNSLVAEWGLKTELNFSYVHARNLEQFEMHILTSITVTHGLS